MSSNNGGGPCGACKFLRRKCVEGCVFAPYFHSEQGLARFAAVHKVFGASNASKVLAGVLAHNRLDAVVTLCYEALARVRDPVYGCVGHIFTLQQQIVSLQAELANIQARLSTIKSFSPLPPGQPHEAPSMANVLQSSSAHMASSTCNESTNFDPSTSMELLGYFNALDRELIIEEEEEEEEEEDDEKEQQSDLRTLDRELVSRYLAGVRFQP